MQHKNLRCWISTDNVDKTYDFNCKINRQSSGAANLCQLSTIGNSLTLSLPVYVSSMEQISSNTQLAILIKFL